MNLQYVFWIRGVTTILCGVLKSQLYFFSSGETPVSYSVVQWESTETRGLVCYNNLIAILFTLKSLAKVATLHKSESSERSFCTYFTYNRP